MIDPRILVFDSGMGGLTVALALRAEVPRASLIYAADNAAFPYGGWDEPVLVKRIVDVLGVLIARVKPDLAVIACNTASTLALTALRATYAVPFVGTVPARGNASFKARVPVVPGATGFRVGINSFRFAFGRDAP